MREALWAIVLAGGEGSRLRALARDASGMPAPKQFCALGGSRPPLAAAIDRAEGLVEPRRVMVSVVEAHRPWWSIQLAARAAGSVVAQPLPRGTATGILLPLVVILDRDPHARVLILPADHAVEDEGALRRALEHAASVAGRRPQEPVLIGVTPTRADGDLGWVVPGGPRQSDGQRVESFVEKPGPRRARRLMDAGALWNTFLLAANGRALLALFERHLPGLLRSMVALGRPSSWPSESTPPARGFADLPTRDFSRDILAPAASQLRLVSAQRCGWTDLGTPERLAGWIAQGAGGSRAA